MPSLIDLGSIGPEDLDRLLWDKAPTFRGWVTTQSGRTGSQAGRQAAEAHYLAKLGGLEAQLEEILSILTATEDETDGDNPLDEIRADIRSISQQLYYLGQRVSALERR